MEASEQYAESVFGEATSLSLVNVLDAVIIN